MSGLPIVARLCINIILFVLYVLVVSVVFSFAFPLILQFFDRPIPNPNDPIFARIQIFIIAGVLLITLIFRKYCYILGKKEYEYTSVEGSYTAKKKDSKKVVETTIKKEVSENKNDKDDTDTSEDIKIYVDKEIK